MIEKEQRKQLESLLQAGMHKKEIFLHLGRTDDLASALVNAPYPVDRARFARANWVLVFLLIYLATLKLAMATANIIILKLPLYMFVFALLYPALFLYAALLVKRFQGAGYSLAAVLSMLYLGNNLDAYLSQEHARTSLVVVSLIVAAATICALSVWLRRCLCLQAGFLGAKKDGGGQYLFLKGG